MKMSSSAGLTRNAIEPWNADNTSSSVQGSLDGWHTLVTQVMGGTVRYFVDGKLIAQHGGKYYPDALMSMNFNLWFIDGGLVVYRASGIGGCDRAIVAASNPNAYPPSPFPEDFQEILEEGLGVFPLDVRRTPIDGAGHEQHDRQATQPDGEHREPAERRPAHLSAVA